MSHERTMPPSGLSAVLFDMDGLLVNTEPQWIEVEHETLAALGGTWSEADAKAIMGASMAHATAHIRKVSGTGKTGAEIEQMLVGGMLERLEGSDIPIQPGARELVLEVAASGLPYALVSASVAIGAVLIDCGVSRDRHLGR